MKLAVLHDSFEGYGGAEYVAIKIAETFDAPLYTSTVASRAYKYDKIITLKDSISSNYILNRSLKALLFRKLKLFEYDIVVGSGSLCTFYKPYKQQKVINYTQTAPKRTLRSL